jgi:tripartite-type tricarboxylate transporter receptor subunit TctC
MMRCLAFAFALFVAAGLASAATAQAPYPERAITLVVNFAAGGGTDVVARLVAIPLAEALGRPVVIENRVGAGGNIGISAVARAAPDGHTILVSSSAFVVNPTLYRQAPYDPIKDFRPIANVGVSPNVIAVRADSDIKTFADLIATAKARPHALNYAHAGVGTTPHLGAEVLKQRTGTDIVAVAYSGGGPATQSVVAGTTEVLVANLSNFMGFIKDGGLRPLVQTGRERWPDLPDVPTLAEVGITNAETDVWFGFWAPARTPQPVIDRLAAEIAKIVQRPDIVQRFKQMGVAAAQEGPDAMAARIARELALYRQIIEAAGIAIN